MKDPVVAQDDDTCPRLQPPPHLSSIIANPKDGRTYERAAISRALQRRNVSPVTKQAAVPIPHPDLTLS